MTDTGQSAPNGCPSGAVNVLFLMIQMTGMGGSERLVVNLVRHLDRRRFSPSVAWFVGEQPLSEFQELGVPLHYLGKRNRFDIGAMSKLARIVRRHRIDVINAHHFMPAFYAFYAARIANRVRLVYTEHSENDVRQVTGKWRLLGQYLLRSCTVLGISTPVSQRLAEHFRLEPSAVSTIENGVDLELFTETASPSSLRAKCGFSTEDVVIGHVANFKKNKNHVFLLKAFRELVRRRRNVKLVLVGRGFPEDADNSESEITAYIQEHALGDCVRVMGYRPDVHDVLRMLDVFCLVSYREGLPLSLIEAMACRLAVVGTRVPGIEAVIQPDVNGLLVEPDDVNGLASALARLADDAALRERLGQSARHLAHERYSLRRCVDETEQVLARTSVGLPSGTSEIVQDLR